MAKFVHRSDDNSIHHSGEYRFDPKKGIFIYEMLPGVSRRGTVPVIYCVPDDPLFENEWASWGLNAYRFEVPDEALVQVALISIGNRTCLAEEAVQVLQSMITPFQKPGLDHHNFEVMVPVCYARSPRVRWRRTSKKGGRSDEQ